MRVKSWFDIAFVSSAEFQALDLMQRQTCAEESSKLFTVPIPPTPVRTNCAYWLLSSRFNERIFVMTPPGGWQFTCKPNIRLQLQSGSYFKAP